LDLSDNGLGDSGLIAVLESLRENKAVKRLILDRNFEKKSKTREKAIEELVKFFSNENCQIESLSIAGNPKSALRGDIVPFIFSLLLNRSLRSLDISGNATGNLLALSISKVLQMNDVLQTLLIDDNAINLHGFHLIKNGLARNTNLKFMPLPIYFSEIKNEKIEIIFREIQQLLHRNCVLTRPKSRQEEKPDEKQNGKIEEKKDVKSAIRKVKPKDIDSIRATVLFSQLHQVLLNQQLESQSQHEESPLNASINQQIKN